MYEMRENQKLIMMVYASKGNKFIGARTKCLQKEKANGNLKKKTNIIFNGRIQKRRIVGAV